AAATSPGSSFGDGSSITPALSIGILLGIPAAIGLATLFGVLSSNVGGSSAPVVTDTGNATGNGAATHDGTTSNANKDTTPDNTGNGQEARREGTLAVTGANVATVGILGLLAMVLGGLLIGARRRRRN
ncbi:LPXTG cell wall anchor domain-containing protein, partial [Corynebacterium sp. CCM 9204]|uniref:LPXTG cell wall anchor domain-containing protein n=1 Tax=Corynebacterium sp. CCM 9204 TaxID=3057616 RepID=UPI0035231C94